MSELPRVSVIIPVYNSEKYLRESLDSVVSQEGVEVELIVVDDGSTDSSREIVREYPSAILIEQEHLGACAARNNGLRRATGEYVKFLDSDDYLEAGILARQAEFMESAAPDEVVFSDERIFNEDSDSVRTHTVTLNPDRPQIEQLIRNDIWAPGPLHRRELLLQVGGFDERLLKAQDYDLQLRLSLAGVRFTRLPGIGTHVRVHLAPHRISNSRMLHHYGANGEIGQQALLDMFRKKYGDDIPLVIRRYFVTQGFQIALVQTWRGDFSRARRTIGRAMGYQPRRLEVLTCGSRALLRAVRAKTRPVRHPIQYISAQLRARRAVSAARG